MNAAIPAGSGRLIFVNRFAQPDLSATAKMLEGVSVGLARDFDVRVLTSRLSYQTGERCYPGRERQAGVEIVRVWSTAFGRGHLAGRVLDYVTFLVSAAFTLWRTARAGDVVVLKTDPPLLSVLCAVVCLGRRAPLVNWLQDLFPELDLALRPGAMPGAAVRLLKRMRDWSLRNAALNVVISSQMREHLADAGVEPHRVTVIGNWSDSGVVHPVQPECNPLRAKWDLTGEFVVGYSGNMGRAHDLHTVAAAIDARGMEDRVRFLFIGDGARKDLIVQASAGRNVRIEPLQPPDLLAESLSAPDVHLVTLHPGVEGLMFPSKLYAAAAAGRPVIVVGAAENEVGRLVETHDFGISVCSGNSAALNKAIDALRDDADRRTRMGLNARRFVVEHHSLPCSVERWKLALSGLA